MLQMQTHLCNDFAVMYSLSQRSVPQLHAQSRKLP